MLTCVDSQTAKAVYVYFVMSPVRVMIGERFEINQQRDDGLP
jgi:hypothetical protein